MASSVGCSNSSVGPVNQLLGLLLGSIYSDQCNLLPEWPQDIVASALQNGFQEYDYIIVGGSSAGIVVATRLTEDPNISVLLVEAGSDPPLESSIPSEHCEIAGTDVDWNFQTELSQYSGRGTNNGIKLTAGKMLGGSGSLNDLLYIRGIPRDFDEWDYIGNSDWGFNDVLPYFKKCENNLDPVIAADSFYHSTGGPLNVDSFNFSDSLLTTLQSGFSELGLQNIFDVNANDKHIGYSSVQGTVQNGARSSAASGYLKISGKRPNLHIIKNAQVNRLRFNKNKTIAGVDLTVANVNLTAFPRKEVILSAGPINTPHVLLNSGIGPAKQLIQNNVKVISNVPVGLNLQDHVVVPYIISYPAPETPDRGNSFYNYLYARDGSFSNIGVTHLNAFFNAYDNTLPFPDVKFKFYALTSTDGSLQAFIRNENYSDEISNSLINSNSGSIALALLVTLLKPLSRGRVELHSNDPIDPPIIITNYLKDPIDVETIIRGIRVAQKFLNTEALKSINATYHKVTLPECDKLVFDSDTYWTCYARYMTASDSQLSGTARMGYPSDPFAVVDPFLRVRGVKGLRVIDSSVIPISTTGETNIASIMIGEKGADLIKEDLAASFSYPYFYPYIKK